MIMLKVKTSFQTVRKCQWKQSREREEAENAGSEEDEEKQAEGEIEDKTVSAVAPKHTDKSVIY